MRLVSISGLLTKVLNGGIILHPAGLETQKIPKAATGSQEQRLDSLFLDTRNSRFTSPR